LLDAGLVEQAHEIANMFPDPVEDEEDDGEEIEGGAKRKKGRRGESSAMPAQSAAEFMVRIDKFVKHHLALAKKQGAGVRDEYKDGLVYEARKATLHQALSAAKKAKKCLKCAG
jgi:DNA-directed RNA polymerase I subunit RPA1